MSSRLSSETAPAGTSLPSNAGVSSARWSGAAVPVAATGTVTGARRGPVAGSRPEPGGGALVGHTGRRPAAGGAARRGPDVGAAAGPPPGSESESESDCASEPELDSSPEAASSSELEMDFEPEVDSASESASSLDSCTGRAGMCAAVPETFAAIDVVGPRPDAGPTTTGRVHGPDGS